MSVFPILPVSILISLLLGPSAPVPRETPPDSGSAASSLTDADSLRKPTIISARSKNPEAVTVSIRAVDISRYPEASVILYARD